ncbi:MAG TPA: hypothetical protein EYP40_06270 [Chromatiales bacterium]|nr:hypothetical protein [Chromatiales bacterium]
MKITGYFSLLVAVIALAGRTGLVQAGPVAEGSGEGPGDIAPIAQKPDLPDRFKISLGGYFLSDFSTTVALADSDLGIGAGIDPARTLGLDFRSSVVRIDGQYRFTPEHSLTYSWYRIASRASKTLNEQIEWGDVIIPIGATVASDFGYDIYKLGYLWSFHHSDKVELAIGAGLHVTRFKLDLNATVVNPPGSSIQDVSITAPLPVISMALRYRITPKLHFGYLGQVFAMSFDQWQGSYTDSALVLEYRFWEHVGLGIGLNGNALEVERHRENEVFFFSQNITGGHLYVTAYF